MNYEATPYEATPTSTKPSKMTKRIILSKLAGIFYPIGAGAATLVKAKIGMQELWQHGLSWDEDIPSDLKNGHCCLMKWLHLTTFDFNDASLQPVQYLIQI